MEPLFMGPVLSDSIRISGNFGELRGSHFHSGIDFKTGEKEGQPVYAAAPGYISRIKVSSGGYGKAIYITHPNDIVTVYGHMRFFYPALEDSVRKLQKAKEDYELELFPDSGAFQLEQGDLIGYSGNTGSSEGPHLHFETRNRYSETPFNPEIAGYLIEDSIPPLISALAIYYPGPYDGLAGSIKHLIEIHPGDATDSIATHTVSNYRFFIGFEAFDKAGSESNQLGIREVNLYFDDSLIFNARIDSFSFDETRMINATIDYPFYAETGRKLVVCKVIKGNRLSFLANKDGMILLNDFNRHTLRLKVEDTSGNSAETRHYIKRTLPLIGPDRPIDGLFCPYGQSQKITATSYRIETAQFSFYEDILIDHKVKSSELKNIYLVAPLISLGPAGIPVHDPLLISIKPHIDTTTPVSKLIAIRLDASGQMQSIKSTYENGWIQFKTRTLGDYSIVLDTLPPVSKTPFWECDDYTGKQRLVIEFADNLSGISASKCYINDSWVPSETNTRKNRVTVFPEALPETDTLFRVRLELIDTAGNPGKYEYSVSFTK